MRGTRHKMRKALVQAVYAWIMGTDNPLSVLHGALNTFQVNNEDRVRAEEMFTAIRDHHDSLESALGDAVEHWDLDRIGVVERAVIYLSLYELKYRPDVPREAAIDEAIRLAREFAGDDSARFVNGIVDAVCPGSDTRGIQDRS